MLSAGWCCGPCYPKVHASRLRVIRKLFYIKQRIPSPAKKLVRASRGSALSESVLTEVLLRCLSSFDETCRRHVTVTAVRGIA
jgi:hypothetical protein